jgi:hypothetical protein
VKRLAYKFTLWKDLGKKGVHEQTIVVTQDSGILALRLIRKGPPSHPNFFMIRIKKVKFIPASCKPNLIFFLMKKAIFSFSHPSQTWMLKHLPWMQAPAFWSSQDV